MNKALLDTDMLSEVGKGVDPIVAQNATVYRRAFGFYTTSTISLMEVVRGFQRTASVNRLENFLVSLATQEVLPFNQDAAELAGRIAGDLERTGQRIGIADPMIAAVALTHSLELVTGNTRHFERIKQLGYPLTMISWRT